MEEARENKTEVKKEDIKRDKPIEDILKPDEKKRDIDKPKKKHGWRNFFIILGVIILVIIIVIAYLGIYSIPLLSSALGANKPKDLGVKISEEAIITGLTKTPWETLDELPEPTSMPLLEVKLKYTGSVPTTNDFTSEEFSSFVNNRVQNVEAIDDVQVRFYEGGAEMSMKLSKYIDAPIYINSGITTTSDKTLFFDVKKIQVGKISVPQKYVKEFEELVTEFISDRMAKVGGFSIDKLEFKDNFVDFVGTWPEKVERAN